MVELDHVAAVQQESRVNSGFAPPDLLYTFLAVALDEITAFPLAGAVFTGIDATEVRGFGYNLVSICF